MENNEELNEEGYLEIEAEQENPLAFELIFENPFKNLDIGL